MMGPKGFIGITGPSGPAGELGPIGPRGNPGLAVCTTYILQHILRISFTQQQQRKILI